MARDPKFDRVVEQRDLDREAVEQASAALQVLFEGRGEAAGVLAQIVSNLPIIALASDPQGSITVAYGSPLDRIGLGDDALVGTTATAWGPEAETLVARTRDGFAHVFDVDGSNAGELLRYRVFGVPDGNGGSLALAIDLSETLAAERASDANRALLETAIEVSGAWIVVQDLEGAILSANITARDELGIELGQGDLSTAISHLDPIHEDGSPFELDDHPNQIASHKRVPQRNVVMGLTGGPDGRRWMTVSALPIEIDGRAAVLTSITDINDRDLTVDLLRDSDERFRLLAEEAPIGIFIVGSEGEMLYANPAAAQMAGRTAQELREIGWLPSIHPDDQQRLTDGPSDFDEFDPIEYRIVRPDGSIRWVQASGAAVHDRDGAIIGLVGTAVDVTAVREAGDRLRESEARTRAIVETAAEAIISCDGRGQIVEFNAAAERIFGYDSDEVIGHLRVFDLTADVDRDRLRGYFTGSADDLPLVGGEPIEILGLHRDGASVPVEMAVTQFESSSGPLFTALIRDLSQHKAIERQLEHLATHDPLTGLPNRALFTAQLDIARGRADRLRHVIAVLFVDIDRVKLVTEALGHRAGDELIEQAAARLRGTVGSATTLGRFSNDQFVLFLEDLDDASDAVSIAVRIIEVIAEPFIVADDEAFVSASVGIAFALDGSGDAETLISNADVAMGRAKASSANRYEVFDSEMRAWVEAQRKTEIALRHGIERAEFELFYQPVVALDSGEVCGHEALVRWFHPQDGLLSPAQFMPLAEESGLIVPLGELILREAIRQSAAWAADPNVVRSNVAINLSARQLESPDLVSVIARALADFGTDPATVGFEITETVLLHDVDKVVQTLHQLKGLGVGLSLDDFGTGYSSLTHLCRLPIDLVKVDRSFVSQLGTGSRDASIVEMVVSLARTLQLDVVAEGVETEEQAAVLRGWGCRYAQGYLFSRPLPVDELA